MSLQSTLKALADPIRRDIFESAQRRTAVCRRDRCAFSCDRGVDLAASRRAERSGSHPRHLRGKIYLLRTQRFRA